MSMHCNTVDLTGRMPELIVWKSESTFSTHVTVSPTVTVLVTLTPAPHGIVTMFPVLTVVVVGGAVVVVVGGAVGLLPAHHTCSMSITCKSITTASIPCTISTSVADDRVSKKLATTGDGNCSENVWPGDSSPDEITLSAFCTEG